MSQRTWHRADGTRGVGTLDPLLMGPSPRTSWAPHQMGTPQRATSGPKVTTEMIVKKVLTPNVGMMTRHLSSSSSSSNLLPSLPSSLTMFLTNLTCANRESIQRPLNATSSPLKGCNKNKINYGRSGLSTWKHQFSYDHWSQATLSSDSTWMGDCSSVAWVLLLTLKVG